MAISFACRESEIMLKFKDFDYKYRLTLKVHLQRVASRCGR